MTTDITTTTPSAVAELPAGLRGRAERILAADRASGAAMLIKSEEILKARKEAAHGDWTEFLKVIRLHEKAAQRHCAIAERAARDERFRQAVIDGWLSFSVAELTARADEELLTQLLDLPEPPTKSQAKALAKPDTGVGLEAPEGLPGWYWEQDPGARDWVRLAADGGQWATAWVMRGLPSVADIVSTAREMERLRAGGWLREDDTQLGQFRYHNGLLQMPWRDNILAAVRAALKMLDSLNAADAAQAAPDAWRQIETEAERYGLTLDWQGNGSVILSWPGEALGDLEPFSPDEALDWLRSEAPLEAERRRPGSPIRSIEAAGWRVEVDHNLYRLHGPGARGPATLVVGRDGLDVAGRELAQRPGLTVDQLSDLVRWSEEALNARFGPLPDDLASAGLRWMDTPDDRLLIIRRGGSDVFAAGQPGQLDELFAQARRALSRVEEAEADEPEPPRPTEAEEAVAAEADLVAAFAAALRDPSVRAWSGHAEALLPVARQLLAGDLEPELPPPPQGERWPVASPTMCAALIHVVRALRAGDLMGYAFATRVFAHEHARAAVVAAARAIEMVRCEREEERAGGAEALPGRAVSPAERELPDDLVAAGVRWQPLKHSPLCVLHRRGMVFASAATAEEAIAQARQKLAEEAQAAEGAAAPPNLPEPPESQPDALAERARACGAEVDVEPGGQRYHVLPPDQGPDEWLTAEQFAEHVVAWETQRPAARAEEEAGGATALPAPSWRDDSPRVARTLADLLACPDANQAAMIAAQLSWALAGGDSTRWTLDLAEILNPDMIAVLAPKRGGLDLTLSERRVVQTLTSLGGSAEAWIGVVRAVAKQLREVGE